MYPSYVFPRNIKDSINSFVANVKPDGINIDFDTDISKIRNRLKCCLSRWHETRPINYR